MLKKIKVGYTNNHITMITNNKKQVIHRGTVRLKTDTERADTIANLKKIGLKVENQSVKDAKGKVVAPNNSFIVTELKGKNGVALYLSNGNWYLYKFEIVGKLEATKKKESENSKGGS